MRRPGQRRHGGRIPYPCTAGGRWLLLAFLVPAGACEDPRPSRTRDAAPPKTAPADGDPWRFRPTFEQSLPPGAVAAPLIEATLPGQAQVRIMAAIVRPGAEPPLSIELWTYDQHNSKDVLQPLGPPMQILRLDPEASPLPALSVLRRQLAAPGTTVVRPIGLAEERTEPFLGLLTGAARVARDSDAEPKTRVDALARLVRGLDDTLLLERDALAETAEALAGGPWMVEREEQLSSRRRQAHVRTPDGHKTVVLMKKEGGWVLSDVRP